MKTLSDFLSEEISYSYSEIEDKFEEYLDDIYEPVELAGMTIYASDMKNIDPVMFRCGVADWSSEEYVEHDGQYYLKFDYDSAEESYNEYLDEIEDEN